MFTDLMLNKARKLLDASQKAKLKLVTAESCTGGLFSALLTEIPGSSATLERGFVTYSNKSKQDMLGVAGDIIADFGAVSEPCAIAMAEGALSRSRADIAIAITGIAGPGGQTPMKPVGSVHIAVARHEREVLHEYCKFGDIGRSEVRYKSISTAIDMCLQIIAAD